MTTRWPSAWTGPAAPVSRPGSVSATDRNGPQRTGARAATLLHLADVAVAVAAKADVVLPASGVLPELLLVDPQPAGQLRGVAVGDGVAEPAGHREVGARAAEVEHRPQVGVVA